jgi:putative ABC transport system permease protein
MTKLAALARISTRDLRQFKLRSFLVVVMIALPVGAMVGAIVYARTIKLEPAQRRAFAFGTADGLVLSNAFPTTPPSVSAGVRLIPDSQFSLRVRRADGRVEIVSADTMDLRDPIHVGQMTLLSGRAPREPSEVLVSPALQRWLHVKVGGTVSIYSYAKPLTVTGIARDDEYHDSSLLVGPDLVPDRAFEAGFSTSWLVKMPPGCAISSLELPGGYFLEKPYAPSTSVASTVDVSMVAGTFVLLEIVFVAAAALAVGARRRERTLALLAAAGGRQRDLASVVLITGLVLGSLGVVAGVVAGIAGARLALTLLAGVISHDVQHLRVPVLAVLGAAGLGFVAALVAAMLPARAVARMNVAAALGGRPLRETPSKRAPIAGIAVLAGGVLLVATGAHANVPRGIELGIAFSLIGAALCGGTLLHAAARVSSHLPAAIRFAARDADRHRRRDAPALGAILAVLATAIALSTLTPQLALHSRFGVVRPTPALSAGEARLEPSFDDVPVVNVGNGPGAAAAVHHALPGSRVGLLEQTIGTALPTPLGATEITFDDSSNQQYQFDGYVPDAAAMQMLGLSATQSQQLRSGRVIIWSDVHDFGHPLPPLTLNVTHNAGDAAGTVEASGLAINRATTKFGLSTLALMSETTARRLRIAPRLPVVLVDHVSKADQTKALDVFSSAIGFPARLGTNGTVGFNLSDFRPPWNITDALVRHHRWVVALALLLALGVLAAAVALSSIDARRDLVRLTTLGLSPSGHRSFSAARAGLLAGLAGVLALPAGLLPAYAILSGVSTRSWQPDYVTIAIVTLAFPIAVIVLAWATAKPIDRHLTADA